MVRGLITVALLALTAIAAPAAGAATHQLYISPRGSDDAAGTASRPLRTVGAAWQRVPRGASGNWHLHLAPGDYRSGAPIYWDERSGSITIEASGARGSAILPAINAFGMRGFKLIGLKLIDGGDVFHCEQCNGVLLSRMILRGRGAQETIKINQSSNVTVADSDVAGAGDNAFDAVAVNHLRLLRNHFHSAEDWCAYAKGGSADVIVRGNLFTDCGTGGFTAGQGTGFQFMSWPFVHYEATGVLVEGNTVRHVEGAAFGVNGGANVLIRNNLASRVGSRSHVLEVTYGGRSCDGAPGGDGWSRCGEYLARGGWGNWLVGDGNNYVRIPNRNVLIYDNLIANPDAQASRWQVFEVPGPPEAKYEASIPFAAHADTGLHIVGNVVWDGGPGHELGLGGASCLPASTCSAASVIANNSINRRRPAVRLLPDGRLIRTGWASALSNHSPPAPDSLARIGSEPTVWSSWPN